MPIDKIFKCYRTLRSQLDNNEISNEEAKERAVKLLADALFAQKNVPADSFDADQLNKLVKWLDEIANIETCNV